MKRLKKLNIILLVFLTVFVFIQIFCPVAFAEEEKAGNWRSTYDVIMLWVNFAILVFVIVKFGRAPLMNFLRGQKNQIEREIERLEKEKNGVIVQIRETEKRLEESEIRFESLKQRLMAQGEKEKDFIIEDAKQQSAIMIDSVQRKLNSQIISMREKIKGEMVDMAFDYVMERLPGEITENDNEKFVSEYMSSIT
jgi:F-type H+-transporting ATPase subunit b